MSDEDYDQGFAEGYYQGLSTDKETSFLILAARIDELKKENEKLRAALKDCESEMRSIVSYIRYEGKWAHDSGILLNILHKADAAAAALKETDNG